MVETDRQSKLRKRVVIIMFPPGTNANSAPLHPFNRSKGRAKTPSAFHYGFVRKQPLPLTRRVNEPQVTFL